MMANVFAGRWLPVLAVCLLTVSCASTAKKEPAPDEPSAAKAAPLPPLDPNVVYEPERPDDRPGKKPGTGDTTGSPMQSRITLTLEAGKLGDAVRAVGEQVGGNLVLMGGLEGRPIHELKFRREPLAKVATELTAQSGLAVQECSDYFFLFQPGYEPLVDVSLSGRLDSVGGEKRTDVAFGSGLKLFTVFTWMSYALDRTIIADNSVAEARCGELALKQVPLESALEAILKSARAVSFDVECTDEYIFIRIPENQNPASALLNTAPLDEHQSQTLDRRVRVVLPTPPSAGKPLEMQNAAVPLSQVLDSLSQQIGVTVVAEKGLEDLPVNPCVMNHVRVKTALDLVVRQWLVADYGYQVTRDRIVIRVRQPASPQAPPG